MPGVLAVTYRWGGFLAPLTGSAPPTVYQAGRTIPVQFQLRDASGAVVPAGSPPAFAASAPFACAAGAVDAVGSTATGDTGSAFRWDSDGQQYLYNDQTDKSLAGQCQTITATLDDGTGHGVTVAFR